MCYHYSEHSKVCHLPDESKTRLISLLGAITPQSLSWHEDFGTYLATYSSNGVSWNPYISIAVYRRDCISLARARHPQGNHSSAFILLNVRLR